MRVLVTGANGFIGRHLVKALEQAGHTVVGWDLPDQDIIRDPLMEILSGKPQQLDAVIHLAAIGSPALCDREPTAAFTVNVQGTHNVLKLALDAGAKRFVFASSAHVYGVSPKYLPTDERHPLRLQDVYTTTKLVGEEFCKLFWDNYGLSYVAIRLFNGYGPGQLPGYFIPDMVQRAKTGRIELRGALITKDWIYIDDVVRAYALALQSPFVGAVNIGTGVETTLQFIAARIAGSCGAEMVISDQPQGGPTRMLCDWGRAQRVLGWRPEIDLEEGIERTIKSAG
jgi:UDP-glucose 4-epimerase